MDFKHTFLAAAPGTNVTGIAKLQPKLKEMYVRRPADTAKPQKLQHVSKTKIRLKHFFLDRLNGLTLQRIDFEFKGEFQKSLTKIKHAKVFVVPWEKTPRPWGP